MSNAFFKCIATVVVALTVGLPAALGFASTPAPPFPGAGEPSGQSVHGNSREGSAVLVTEDLAPGDSHSQTVTITNQEPAPTSFALSKAALREKPGFGGGKLSTKLELRVEYVTDARPSATVYRGTVGSMSRQPLGRFAAGESRTYRFTATLPDGGVASPTSGDNAYMGASMSLDFHWTSSQ